MVEKYRKYTEVEGYTAFNWNTALSYPDELIEWHRLRSLASQWVTCACGNLCNAIPRDLDGEPRDTKLRVLGVRFMEAINSMDKNTSLNILKDIEHRSIELLKAMGLLKS